MVTAFCLLKISRDKVNDVAQQLSVMQGITEVYSVAGQWDLIAVIRAKDNESLAELVTGQMLKVDGITDSMTHIAFRVYSNYDLERLFSVGA
jgi:DNA-binding Lrp family transcriptional regulator